jgi:Ser/Thr protein kinase RdoA (MazF antagonist)
MALFAASCVSEEEVRAVVKESWDLTIDSVLKVSQNTTFLCANPSGIKFIARATPSPTDSTLRRIRTEVRLLQYLDRHGLSVSPAIPSKSGDCIAFAGAAAVVVFSFAKGDPVVYTDLQWLDHGDALGRWFKQFHALSAAFSQETPPEVPRWDELHGGILAAFQHGCDANSDNFGLIHGDVNPSNYFWAHEEERPQMFDWDQLQSAWYLYDLASPIWGALHAWRTGLTSLD